MSDREGSYGQSPLATLNMAYSMNQPRVSPSNPSTLAPRRPNRSSYRPGLSPPPDIALPAPPSFATASMTASSHSQLQPLRISNQPARGYTSHHPYSAQSLASTPDIDQDYADGFLSHNDRNHRAFYRSQAHSSLLQQPTANSQAQSHNLPGRLQSSSNTGSLQQGDLDLAYASASPVGDRTATVSPGSYFVAYPQVAPPSQDRSDSESSAISGGSSSRTASASAMSPSQNRPSTPPPLTQPAPHRTPPRPSNAAQSSSNRHAGASHSHRNRPSSRRALTAALELAKSAVLLDQTNDDPQGAVQAYANTVRLLGEVMDRVMRGEDPPPSSTNGANSSDAAAEDRRRRGRRRSGVVAKEEEVRRLKAIHDTYADRLTILCLIYSIPHPSPLDRPVGGHSSSTPPNHVPHITPGHAGASSSGLPPQQIESTVSLSGSERDAARFPDAPGDIHPEEYASREDTATIRKGYLSNGADNELESDSEREHRTHEPASRQRETEASVSAYGHQQQKQNQYSRQVLHDQNVSSHTADGYNTDTPPRLHSSGSTATPIIRSYSQDAPTAIPASISLSAFRNSIIPPPRPPPSGPLPTRPRIANGTIIPPQLLNQPLPPLPPIPKPQSPTDIAPLSSQYPPTPVQPQTQSLTRQSSASSVSGLSGASSNASGSSAASNLFVAGQPANATILLPSTLPPSAALNAPPANATLSPPSGRPRGNSTHGRNLSNAERLVVVTEEKEEDEGTIRNSAAAPGTGATSTTPPQEHKFRSRSSSMVSLKDRDRAKAQVLGNMGQAPLPPLPGVQRQPSSEGLLIPSPVPSPNTATFGAKTTPRTRGSSVGSSVTQASDEYIPNGSSSSTTPVANMPYTAGGAPAPGSTPIIVPGAVGGSGLEGVVKLNPNTKEGAISLRRNTAAAAVPMSAGGSNQSGHGKLTSAILPASTATSLGLTGRLRAASNPGKWSPSMMNISMGETTTRPPMPPPPMSAGPRRQFPAPSAARYQAFGMPSPSGSVNASSTSLVPLVNGVPIAGMPASAPPSAPPALAILRPYHLMSLLRKSMTDRSGGFVTPRLHVPHEVWTQGSARLTNTAEKTKVIDVLVAALEELANASVDFCGSSSGVVSSVGGGERKQGERWAGKLEDFDRAFNQVGVSFGKKLGVGEGFVVKKSVGVAAWSNKFFDKIAAAGKPYDSPMAYANLLTKLFGHVQLLDEHSRASQMSPQPPAYASLPQDVRNRIDTSLKSISELFSKVVLTFVFRDLSLMLDKYHKTCDRWIQSNPGNPA